MSFGFGVGDFIAVGTLAFKTWKACSSASSDFKALTSELSSLHIALESLKEDASDPSSSLNRHVAKGKPQLMLIIHNLEEPLLELDELSRKYASLGRAEKRNWDRIRFAAKSLDGIRTRLQTQHNALELFLAAYQSTALSRIEEVLADLVKEVQNGKREPTVISMREGTDEHDIGWELLEQELLHEGISRKDVVDHRQDIVRFIISITGSVCWDTINPSDSISNTLTSDEALVTSKMSTIELPFSTKGEVAGPSNTSVRGNLGTFRQQGEKAGRNLLLASDNSPALSASLRTNDGRYEQNARGQGTGQEPADQDSRDSISCGAETSSVGQAPLVHHLHEAPKVEMLDRDIRQTYENLSANTKCAILNALWDGSYSLKDFNNHPSLRESYFRYYTQECDNAFACCSDALHLLIVTHQDIVDIIFQLRNPSTTRQSLKQSLSSRLTSLIPSLHLSDAIVDSLCSEAIDLCVRLWLMIDVGTAAPNSFTFGQKRLLWQSDVHDRISAVVAAQFTAQIAIRERVRLGRSLNACNLERMVGLRIVWTNNLADHLRLTEDDSRIDIFHHASFLKDCRASAVFPSGFVEETLSTLALLLPQYDKKSRRWYRSQGTKSCLDEEAIKCGGLSMEKRQIERFVFWHDRLLILQLVFDETEPRTISQWWNNRTRRR
jgi:hypothetical protein